MRVTTLAILGLLVLAFPGLTRNARAADNPKTLTEQLQESGLLAPADPAAPTPSENSRRELFSEPLVPGANSDTNSRQKLFSEPLVPGEQQAPQREKVLSQGSEGSEVAAVQERLQAHGFDPGSIDSVFGARTAAAVSAFQQSQGLKADGVVNQQTWNALAEIPAQSLRPAQSTQPQVKVSILAKGATGSKVKTLQARLESQGFEPGPVDGVFGSRTMAAVQDFQQAKGLNADGVVDETTWITLGKN